MMKTAKQKFLTSNILLLVLEGACLVYYDFHGGLWLKGVTSAWFVLLGFLNLFYAGKMHCTSFRATLLMVFAMFLGMTADVLLGIAFMVGTAVFALGHILYFFGFCVMQKFHRRDLYAVLPIGAVSLFIVLGTPYIQVEDTTMKLLLIGYAIVISCMLGKSISNLVRKKSTSSWLMAVGSILFWFSDLMLALSIFGSGGKAVSFLCMYSYWPGQSILAHSLFHFINENHE